MKRMLAFVAVVAVAGCALDKQNAPALTGPSEFGLSLDVAASPDIVPQDGQSRSVVTVTARDPNSQPVSGLTLRAEIAVGGVLVDFGTLSSRTISTGSDGRASVTYTAPPQPSVQIDTDTIVTLLVTPIGSNFANSHSGQVSVRLTPPGVVIGPNGTPVPKMFFSPTAPRAGENVLFDASASTDDGQIVSYFWQFGDGHTASGRVVNHTYEFAGTYNAVLTVTDDRGLTASTAPAAVAVAISANPVSNFSFSPTPAVQGQNVFFNGSLSTAIDGRTIVSYEWDFGDGAFGSGVTVAHIYGSPGTYNVVLKVIDDTGRVGTSTKSVTIAPALEQH